MNDLYRKAEARLARERGGVSIDRAKPVRVALAFPNVYGVGMASLGYQLVYRLINSRPAASCERVFLPDSADLNEHERTRTELFTLESQSPLSEFDVVAFSVSFELDYLNVLRMLRLAGVPIASAERDETHPLVIAGGPCATFNPEPLADFIDAFVIGEAEDVLPALIESIRDTQGQDRTQRLVGLAALPNIYVPAVPGRTVRATCRDLSKFPTDSCISAAEGEFGEITLVEVARGCGRSCRFCVAGHITRPPRPRCVVIPNEVRNPLSVPQEKQIPRVARNDYEAVRRYGLVGASVFDHVGAVELCRQIIESGGEFTVSSVRLETVTPEIAQLLAKGGQKTLTIAPEAGAERLRRVINKHCTDDQVFQAVTAAQEAGVAKVKLYFMVGLPTETDADIDAITDLARRLAERFPSIGFRVSASCFVPKPWTPFQWHPMERDSVLKKRFALLSKSKIKGVELGGESPRLAWIQGLLARGDRRVGLVLRAALANGGDYRAALRETGINLDSYLYRARPRDELLPWEHIDARLDKERLWQEYEKSLSLSS